MVVQKEGFSKTVSSKKVIFEAFKINWILLETPIGSPTYRIAGFSQIVLRGMGDAFHKWVDRNFSWEKFYTGFFESDEEWFWSLKPFSILIYVYSYTYSQRNSVKAKIKISMAYGYIELEVKENNTAVMNTAIIKCVLGDYLKIF